VVDWTRNQLSEEELGYLRGLRLFRHVAGFTLVHSTLDTPEKWGYVFEVLEAEAHFNYQTTSVCFFGHTHVPMVFEKQSRVVKHDYGRFRVEMGSKYYVNVGSVGQPRDGDPRCCYAIYDLTKREIEYRRLDYDIAATQEKIRQVGLPERLAKRLSKGK
jgi:diadenosine tetraphosphatase ApaH/serine/threonine PP2A family protein phosphatase